MGNRLRVLRRSDVAQVISGWNSCFPYDGISEEKFRNTVFDDANFKNAGNMLTVENQKIVGFVAAVTREGITDQDVAGTIEEKDFGYIKGLFMLNEYRDSRVRKELLNQALE